MPTGTVCSEPQVISVVGHVSSLEEEHLTITCLSQVVQLHVLLVHMKMN